MSGGKRRVWRLLIRTLPPRLRAEYGDEVVNRPGFVRELVS